MNFQHLIQINDPDNPLIPSLTRQQIWNGLVLRAELPMSFIPHLDACELRRHPDGSLARDLRYGDLHIHDTVSFAQLERIVFAVAEQGEISASTLTMSIEEPAQDMFFVRFDYALASTKEETSEEAYYNEFRRSAYVEADIDTIRVIREMAESGQLDLPLC